MLASAGLAILVATAGYRGMTDEAGRRLVLAALLFVLTAPVAAVLWFQHPAVEVAVRQIVPQPGAPLALSGALGSRSHDQGSDERSPFLEGTFGSLEIADIGAPSSDHEDAQAATFHVGLPVAASDCGRLEAEFGGGCCSRSEAELSGGCGPVLRDFEGFEILTLRRKLPLTALIRPRSARTVELIETTARAQQRVPTEWNLAHDGSSTDVDLYCFDGAPLEVRIPFGDARASATCALASETFRLSVEVDEGPAATLFLNELGKLEADVTASAAEAVVDRAELSVDGGVENLPSSPVRIALDADEGESVDLELDQSLESDLNEVSLSSAGVSSVTVGDRERVPNWFEQHSELMYFVAGILLATLVPALFDFILARLRRDN